MIRKILIGIILTCLLTGCYKELPVPGIQIIDTPDWTEETHGANVEANYGKVFPIDYGDGNIYFGLYTLVEDVDDVFTSSFFSDPSGFLYKPEGQSASFNNKFGS